MSCLATRRYAIVKTMLPLIRIAVCIISCFLLLIAPNRANSEEIGPLHKFTPVYKVVHGGLKISSASADKPRMRVGLALGGGGAKAAAAVGVLKVLAKEGIIVDKIAGTSMGAIVGGLAAAGKTPEEIESLFLHTDWNDLFTDTPSRIFLSRERKEEGIRHILQFSLIGGRFIPPAGLTAGQKLSNVLIANTLSASFQARMNFDLLPIPFRAIATDLETGAVVAIDKGFLHDAMRASAAIPVIFPPVETGGRLLIDGGLSNNLPVNVVKDMGADIVIALDASTPLERKERISSLVEVMSQSIAIPIRRETEKLTADADVVIKPDTSAYSFADFDRIAEIIEQGEAAAHAALPRIKQLLQRNAKKESQERFLITEVSVYGNRYSQEQQIRDVFLQALPPAGAASEEIVNALGSVFNLGVFSDVEAVLSRQGDGFLAVLTVRENPVVKAVRISGCKIVQESEIMDQIGGQLDKPLNAAAVAAALDRVVKRYRELGFIMINVKRASMLDDNRTLSIEISEGKVDSINMIGQRRTKISLIKREIETDIGSPLNVLVLINDIQHLFGLGYFESISIDAQETTENGMAITFKIKERPRGTVRLGLRYDLDDAFTGLTDVIVDNIAGKGIKLFINTRYGNYTDIAAGYHSPVFVNTFFVHSLKGFFKQRTYDLYNDAKKTGALEISSTGADLAFGYQWFRFGDTYLRYRFESDRVVSIYGATQPDNPTHIGSLAFLTSIDTRDNQIFPQHGVLFRGSYEVADSAYGGNVDFRKTTLSGQIAFSTGARHTLVTDFSAGFGSGNLPYQEQFGIGGIDHLLGFPVPGFHRREFVGSNELAGLIASRWKIQDYQLKAVRSVYFVLTGGAANVWDSRDAISTRVMHTGISAGIHADTIVGPFRLDFGAGENRRYLAYFSAGFDF